MNPPVRDDVLAIVVPHDHLRGPLRHVRRGSGMVARRVPGSDLLDVYFEGNLYGAVNLERFEDRVLVAADRLVTRYPTTAMMSIALTDVEVVGTCYLRDGLVLIGRPELVELWVDTDTAAARYTNSD